MVKLTGLNLKMYKAYRFFFIPACIALKLARNFGVKKIKW